MVYCAYYRKTSASRRTLGAIASASSPEFHGGAPAGLLVLGNRSNFYFPSLHLFTMLDPIISRETVVIFDEAYDVLHECRALIDYSTAYIKTFRMIAATKAFSQIAVVFSNQPKEPSNAA